MTYPPNQGPYGQQPGGWGPQQPPQQPPQPPPGYDQTQQWNYPGGFPEDEPPKKRTGLIIGIVAAVLVIAATIGVTGFWKPGFFLAGDEGDDGGGTDNPGSSSPQVPGSSAAPSTGGPPPKPSIQPPGSTPPTQPTGGGPVDSSNVASVAQATVDAFNARDNEAFKEQFCDPSDADSARLEQMPPEAKMTITGDPKITGDKAKVPVEMTLGQGEPLTEEMPLENQSGRWCVTNE